MVFKFLPRKVALVTGAGQGIGFQTSLALALRNFKVIMVDKDDLSQPVKDIIEISGNSEICQMYVDLKSLKSVRTLVNEINSKEEYLDVLINNAGIFESKEPCTEDGLDPVMQVNHFGPFLLTNLLLDSLKRSKEGRVIFVNSIGSFLHTPNAEDFLQIGESKTNVLTPLLNYYNSKLYNMAVSKTFATKPGTDNLTFNCLHPGMTNTNFLFKNIPKYMKPIMSGFISLVTQDSKVSAEMPIFLATSNTIRKVSGKYFVNYQISQQPKILENEQFCEKIWQEAERSVGVKCN